MNVEPILVEKEGSFLKDSKSRSETKEELKCSFDSQSTIASGEIKNDKFSNIEREYPLNPSFQESQNAKEKIRLFEDSLSASTTSSLSPARIPANDSPEKLSVYFEDIFSHLVESQVI